MSRRTLVIIGGIVIVLLVAGGGYYFWQQSNAQRATAAARQTGTLTRGELVATVTGAGNITAPEQTNLSFSTSGVPITKINVKVGDTVKAGTVLAEEDATQLQQALQTAETQFKSAQAALKDAQEPATSQEIAIAESKVKSTQASYDSAQAALAALKAPPAATDLQAAQASVASAKANYDAAAAKAGMKNEQITVARATLEKARITLEAAQAAYNAIAWQDNAPHSTQAKDLQTATIDYESAQANYNLAMADINDSSLKSALSSLAQAQSSLADLTAAPTAEALASAQAAVETASQNLMQAKQDLETLQEGTAETDLLSAQGNVDSAQAAYDEAKRALDQAKLVAPFDGTIATVSGFVGKTTTAADTVITLVNTTKLETQLSLSEVDVSQVKPAQEVELTFDALSGRTFPAKVESISPLGTQSSGVVNYNVTVGLTNPDPAILPGMTAQASIVIQRVADALIAPSRAVRTQGNRRIMTLLFEGREIPLIVQTGLTSESGTQILSAATTDGQAVNLQEGDTVILNTTTTSTNQGGPGGFGGGPGGFGVPVIR